MRILQTFLLILGAACFLTAHAYVGDDTGDVLWRGGVAVLMMDKACLMLWPRRAVEHKR